MEQLAQRISALEQAMQAIQPETIRSDLSAVFTDLVTAKGTIEATVAKLDSNHNAAMNKVEEVFAQLTNKLQTYEAKVNQQCADLASKSSEIDKALMNHVEHLNGRLNEGEVKVEAKFKEEADKQMHNVDRLNAQFNLLKEDYSVKIEKLKDLGFELAEEKEEIIKQLTLKIKTEYRAGQTPDKPIMEFNAISNLAVLGSERKDFRA